MSRLTARGARAAGRAGRTRWARRRTAAPARGTAPAPARGGARRRAAGSARGDCTQIHHVIRRKIIT